HIQRDESPFSDGERGEDTPHLAEFENVRGLLALAALAYSSLACRAGDRVLKKNPPANCMIEEDAHEVAYLSFRAGRERFQVAGVLIKVLLLTARLSLQSP